MRFRDRLRAAWLILRGKTGPVRAGSPFVIQAGQPTEWVEAVEEWAERRARQRREPE